MVMMCGVGSVWGQNVLETIGNTDFSTGYLGAESNSTKQTLDADGTVHFRFVNHNNLSTDNYKNFILVVRNQSSPAAPLVALRADNWENVAGNNSGLNNNFDWTNFPALMNGATVDMNITRSGTSFIMTSTITTTTGTVYNYSYTKNNLATGTITVGLSVEEAYLDVLDAYSGWLINFGDIGDRNKLADKAEASIGVAVDNGMGNVTLGEPLNTNFGIQTGTTWLYRTAQKALYSSNGGGRNFGVFNAKAKQVITLDISAAPTPTNATLKSSSGNVRTYEVTADGTVTFNLARYNYIYSIKVEDPSLYKVNYTVRYVDGEGNELKASTENSASPGSEIVLSIEKNSFLVDGIKYIYLTDDAAGKTVAEDGSTVVTITFRLANTYTVNAKYNRNIISTSSVFEGDDANVYVPYFQFENGILYGTPSVDKGTLSYGQVTVNNVLGNTDVNVSYKTEEWQNAVFYSEAENIPTLTQHRDNFTQVRMSGGAVGYAESDGTVIATLPPGKYTISSSTRAGTTRFFAGDGDTPIYELSSTGAVSTSTSEEFTLDETTDIKVSAGSASAYFDYVLIRMTSTVEYTVNYYLEDNHSTIIHTEKRQGLPGSHPVIEHENIVFGYTTYTYVSDNSNSVTIKSDGSTVVSVYVSRPPLHWTVVSSTGKELASGYGVDGQEYKIHYPRYILNENKQLYYSTQLSDNNKEYALSFTLSQNNQVETVTYNSSNVNNVELVCEGEDIPGMTVLNTLGFHTRTSNGAVGYSANEIVIASGLRSGKYKLTINTYNGSGSSTTAADRFDFKVTIGGETVMSFVDNANGLTQSVSTEFGVKDETIQLVMPAGFAGSDKCGIDNFFLERVGDFVPTPTITHNLRSNYKVEVNKSLVLAVAANDAAGYQWYKWTGTATEYENAIKNGYELSEQSGAEIIADAKSNSYTYTAGAEINVVERIFCQAKGFENNTYSVLAAITTIAEVDLESVMVPFYKEEYDNTSLTGWNGTAVSAVVNHAVQISNNATGARDMYMQLSHEFLYAPVNDGTWSLDFDFQPTDNSPSSVSIYNSTYGIPTANTVVPDANAFFALRKNGDNYDAYLNGSNKGSIALENGKWYHVCLKVEPNGTEKITASVTESTARAIPFNASSSESLASGMELGGIHCFMDRYAKPVNFDNVLLKVKTTDVLIATDLAESYEGNDDEYLNEGAGLNFDVPAATEFEWYVSSVAPSKDGDGTTVPKIKDGTIIWDGHPAFMTVKTAVDRETSAITKTNGVDTNDAEKAQSKHAVTPPATGNGSYAYQLVSTYPTVQTVWDEATTVNYNDGTGVGNKSILRYYPEATASGSRWHYLRQLDSGNEDDHIDYVWCVASNALGSVTSSVAQIDIYPQAPLIYLLDDYQHMDADGDRYDMTLPANYKFRNEKVKINANNLIFNTAEKPVPHKTVSFIQYLNENGAAYTTTTYPFDATRDEWTYNGNTWNGVLSTTQFTGFDGLLNANSSVHGYYKSFGTSDTGIPIDFTYGLRQMLNNNVEYHAITKDSDGKYIIPHGGAQYVIGVDGESSLQGKQTFYCDFGRYPATEFGSVSTKTTWDWSKLPERKFLTYNLQKYKWKDTDGDGTIEYGKDDTPEGIIRIGANGIGSVDGTCYVVDPETNLGGPEMGKEYLMADFYGYKPEELGGFPSDKVKIGLEVLYDNDSKNPCLQGNAFIIKPEAEGTLDVLFSTTNGGVDRYLVLECGDVTTSYKDAGTSGDKFSKEEAKTIRMAITQDMIGKEVAVRACNVSDDVTNQYFRIYSATYTPTTKPVEFTEWKADDRDMSAAGGVDTYSEVTGAEKSDGFVSLVTKTPGAVIKYKIITGIDKTDLELNSIAADIDNLNVEELTYKEDEYTDSKDNKIGIHCRVNSTIFAWAEIEGMNRSEVVWHRTNATTYPVDMRFMHNFDTSTITSQTDFDNTYWGTEQSSLSSKTMDELKALSTTAAPKAWKASQYGTATIDGVDYIADNFEKLYITHGTTIDIYIKPNPAYTFAGWGAPSFSGGNVVDMMRNGNKAKFVHYHLLYDKAKAKTTAGIAFLVANFTKRTEPLTASLYVKEDGTDVDNNYKIPTDVLEGDKIIAPVYHTAHDRDGITVTHWTDDYRPADAEGHYEDYFAGEPKQIYQNTLIKPVYRDNTFLDNYLGRSVPMTATWWFTRDHYAQNLTMRNEYNGFSMPYVTPVKRSDIGTVTEDSEDNITFDLPMIITPGTSGRLDNTISADWCSVGRGVKFTVPVCSGTDVTMEVRSKLSPTEGGTTFGGEYPVLWKVKYKGEDEYVKTQTPDASKTVEAYIYKYTYAGAEETCDIVLGNDYSYIRNIGVSMPVVTSNRDAALITTNFADIAQDANKPYGEGTDEDGYEFHHISDKLSVFKAHYSGEHCIIGKNEAMSNVEASNTIAPSVPYVNGMLGYVKSNETTSESNKAEFIIGPFRSITHIRYLQGSSSINGGGWSLAIGRSNVLDLPADGKYDGSAEDPRLKVTSTTFNDVQWSNDDYGTIHNSTTPQWVELNINEHIYPEGKDNSDVSYIESADYTDKQGDIYLRFYTDRPDVYLFEFEIYGVDPTADQQVSLVTGVLAANKDADTNYEESFRAGSVFHIPDLMKLDEHYVPLTAGSRHVVKQMQYNIGRKVTLQATANTGYDFLKWVKPDGKGGWTDVPEATNPYTFNITDDMQLYAVFVHRGIINYTTDHTNYGLMPEQVQTDAQGGFTVADNRGLYAGEGQSLLKWQDAMPTHEWYTGHKDVSNTFNVSTNVVGVTTESKVERSRAVEGGVVDAYPQFGTNELNLIDVVGRNGATARWQFGKKNGALTMQGAGTTPRIVTQALITGTKEVVDPEDNKKITETTVTETIDVSMEMKANVNNAGRADEYAVVEPDNRYTIPATRGMKLEFKANSAIQYSIDGGKTFQAYTESFKYYGNDSELVIALRDATAPAESFELEYIQATYYQRAQKPILSMQKVDVVGTNSTNNVQVDVQTSDNPTATRFYTLDGSDPQYEATATGVIPKPGTTTRLVRGNYITINENQIHTGTQLKVISVCPERPDSKLSTLDLEPYDKDLALATYIYDSRIISIHNDQIFQKLLKDHKGHFNLMSYDLNPNAAKIPELITDHTTVFITSDKVSANAMDALTNPGNPSAHGQKFLSKPFILGTPLYLYWNAGYDNDGYIISTVNDMTDPSTGGWLGISWQKAQKTNPATATSPATITYTEWLRAMKNQPTRVDASQTYAEYYADQIAKVGNHYVLGFYDGMLLDKDSVCISNTTTNAPEDLSANGTQLVFNATELLTRPNGNGGFVDVSTFNKMILAMMAPSPNPQLIDVKLSYTQDVIDYKPDATGWIAMDAPMLSALSDGVSVMSSTYLASSYPQFVASTVNGFGHVEIKNVEVAKAGDDLSKVEKLGAQGVKDLATIITLTHPAEGTDAGDPDFKREYRIEYKVATEDITFRKDGNSWVCNENELWTLTEAKDATGQPTYKLLGPQNFGIKNVSFNGYAVAPDAYFDDNGEIKAENSIWGRGEKFNPTDAFSSPTAYNVTEPLIPEYSVTQYNSAADKSTLPGLSSGQWMTSEFPWGFKDCNQMAFTLLNITDYVGDIKVTCYRRQAESPKLLSAKVKYKYVEENIVDNMELDEPNGEFVLEFNSVMHEVRKPGEYDTATGKEIVTWTVHVIPEENYPYDRNNPTDFSGVNEKDIPGNRFELYSEGGTKTLRFQYWNLTPGKKYYLHIPFHVLRGAVGTGVPYHLPAEFGTPGFEGPEAHMSWTNYPDVPYFDIPFTVKEAKYVHKPFDYIVNNDDWWAAYKSDKGAQTIPDFAKWDGDFVKGINEVKGLDNDKTHDHYYMHVQKKLDASGKPVAYTYGTGNAGLMQFKEGNFSIVGEDMDNTIITAKPEAYHDSDYRGLREDAGGNQTSTIHLDANNVYMQDLTIQNTQEGLDQPGQEYPALFDHGNRNVFYGVNIDGFEESFAVFGTLSYLEKSRVSGYGDFIVGSGDAWLDSCDIVLRNRELINLCAPSTKATNKWGFVFNDCNITREANAIQVLDHNWTLARPWKGYDTDVTKSPAVTFINTSLELQPTSSGYGSLDEGLVLRFHEYGTKHLDDTPISLSTRSIANCTPDPASDAPVLTPEQAAEYTVEKVFGRDNGGYDPKALTRQAKAPVLANDGMVLHWTADPSDLCYLVYYLGDEEKPDWDHAMMFCCVPGVEKNAEGNYPDQAYCYLTNHDISPIFRTGGTSKPISFSELWYGRRKSNAAGADYDGDVIDGMGKESPSRLWFAVRAANQMGGLSPVSNEIMYHAAHQYRTTIKSGGVKMGDDSGNAYSTIYLDFQALAPKGVKAYALTGVSSAGDDGTAATTLTFERVNNNDDRQDVVYANQGYLIYGPYGKDERLTSKDHVFIETTTEPTVKLTSNLSGTVGVFKNVVSEKGYGETEVESADGIGWSIAPNDYDDVPKNNVNAFTLQKYDNMLGFYKFTGANFSHHRAYLDTETATKLLMGEGYSLQMAQEMLSRGVSIRIVESDGRVDDITSVFMDAAEHHGVYDLMGRKIQPAQMQPGRIYIVDGKKSFCK